jgi:hypothetical protein
VGIFPLDEIRQGDCNVSAIMAMGIKIEERWTVEILFGERERERATVQGCGGVREAPFIFVFHSYLYSRLL